MFLLNGDVVFSPSDLSVAAECEFGLLRRLDFTLGRVNDERAHDAMLERTASLGAAHEALWKSRYLEQFGPWNPSTGAGVYEVARPEPVGYRDPAVLDAKAEETIAALRGGADVVVQGCFFDGTFLGWSDFLVKQSDGSYAVFDTKLARHAKVTAVLQLASYGDQLRAAGIATAPTVHLVLGDHNVTSHDLDDLLPLLRHRRSRLNWLGDRHLAADGPALWNDTETRACGRCDLCSEEAGKSRDLLLVAGLSMGQRASLRGAGIMTIDELAASEGPVSRIGLRVLDRLRAQAALQVRQNPPSGPAGEVAYELFDPAVVHGLPESSPGDIFFDFEGDPLWSDGESIEGGLEYLFGWVETPVGDAEPEFTALWAHDRAQEKTALEGFIAYLLERRKTFPGMHVFHYAPYETTALKRLVGRHGTCEAALDDLLRTGMFVDLFSTVRKSLRVSQASYSIKKLEPLYMEARDGLDNAAESITDYAEACELRDSGDRAGYSARLERIRDYNRDDCRSTYLLREWLQARGAEHPREQSSEGWPQVASEQPEAPGDPAVSEEEARSSSLIAALDERAEQASGVAPADADAYRLLGAALGYHRREEKPFWWAHYARLSEPVDEWSETRDVFRVDVRATDRTGEERFPWQPPEGRKRTWLRTMRLAGELEPGSSIREGAKMWPVYEAPGPSMEISASGTRGWNSSGVKVTGIHVQEDETSLEVEEAAPSSVTGENLWPMTPMALTPQPPPHTKSMREAIASLATRVVEGGELTGHAGLSILRRIAPQGVGEAVYRVRQEGPKSLARAITEVLRDLDPSYVAVQGPPGTGKTFTGSRVIKDLVNEGWKVGVVAQSHAVVENLLRAVLAAGVDPALVGKKPATEDRKIYPWRPLAKTKDWAEFLTDAPGCVVGGTAWDFSNRDRVGLEELDLLVIDEAGQFSLANTLAVSDSAKRILLLGDPQQLPQVSQGIHPFPVDGSALGWLVDGHPTMPEHMGFFLDKSYRMHPELCEPVSVLSYSGLLESMPLTGRRRAEGIEPGLHTVAVEHSDNRTASHEEAEEVVALVRDVIGRRWQDPERRVDRPMTSTDVIVVAAYNAQVGVIRQALDAAGLQETPVGTVDKFQGQEAPVAIVSLAASSAQEVPRGMEFLINRNRLNVAISRGQYASFLVHSPRLRDYLPANVDGLEELGAFIRLGERGQR